VKPNEEAMLKALVAIAWADGRFADEESEIVEAMIDTLRVDAEGAELIRAYSKTPRTLDDVPVAELDAGDRQKLFRHAVILSHIDGRQDDSERSLILEVAARLAISDDDTARLIADAEAEASALLDV
jgi:tellurite resistance protein